MRFSVVLLVCTLFSGCRPVRHDWDSDAPHEQVLILLPRERKVVLVTTDKSGFPVDVGIDFDGPADTLSLEVHGDTRSQDGSRLAGSPMRLVVCGFPMNVPSLRVSLKNNRNVSVQAAVRVEKHKSDMCKPFVPVLDEYWARL